MTTLPLTLAMIALSQNPASSQSSADFNNDGNVDTTDLIALTSAIGTPCSGDCPTDLNNDGVTDQQDILVLMQFWGAVEGWVNPNTPAINETSNDTANETTEPSRDPNRDMSWQNESPKLFNSIYYEDHTRVPDNRRDLAILLDQGAQSKAWSSENNVNTIPYAYYGGVDWNANGELTETDKEKFANWLNENIDPEYDGPLCLDMEGEWWGMFDTSNQNVMNTVMDFYIECLEYAQTLRPNAKIGYFGLPKRTHTKDTSTTADVSRLLQASTALFPNVYDFNPNPGASDRLRRHIEKTMEMVNGEIPVYAQTFLRYKNQNSPNFELLHTLEEFMQDQVQASLDAVWTDANGKDHHVNGVALWDAYSFVSRYTDNWSQMSNEDRKAHWDDVDAIHVEFLSSMKSSVDAACDAIALRAQAQQEDNAAQTAAEEAAHVAAAQEEASRLRAERKRQRSRLVRRLNSERTKIRRATSDYRKNAKQFQSARNSFKNKRQSFNGSRNAYRAALKQWRTSGSKQARGSKARSTAWKKFATVRTQYRSSVSSWQTNVKSWRASAKNFRNQHSSYRTSRKAWQSTVKTWRTANATWRQMARKASTLAAVGQ